MATYTEKSKETQKLILFQRPENRELPYGVGAHFEIGIPIYGFGSSYAEALRHLNSDYRDKSFWDSLVGDFFESVMIQWNNR